MSSMTEIIRRRSLRSFVSVKTSRYAIEPWSCGKKSFATKEDGGSLLYKKLSCTGSRLMRFSYLPHNVAMTNCDPVAFPSWARSKTSRLAEARHIQTAFLHNTKIMCQFRDVLRSYPGSHSLQSKSGEGASFHPTHPTHPGAFKAPRHAPQKSNHCAEVHNSTEEPTEQHEELKV